MDSNRRPRAYESPNPIQLVNKLPVSHLAELTNFTKSYISQVKNGKKKPSRRLLNRLIEYQRQRVATERDYLSIFLQSRKASDSSSETLRFYKVKLGKFFSQVNADKARQQDIEKFLLQFKTSGNRHAYFKAIRTLYRWREQTFALSNPMKYMKAPKMGKLILPSLTQDQVLNLIQEVHNIRDKAIIALFNESGHRLSELANVSPHDIDWDARTIRVIGKGRKEAYAPFGELSDRYIKQWISQHKSNGKIWGINTWGINIMLRRLAGRTGLPCNPHTFRRTFACLLRKRGLDCLTIKDLGRWESIEMVQRYTRSSA